MRLISGGSDAGYRRISREWGVGEAAASARRVAQYHRLVDTQDLEVLRLEDPQHQGVMNNLPRAVCIHEINLFLDPEYSVPDPVWKKHLSRSRTNKVHVCVTGRSRFTMR